MKKGENKFDHLKIINLFSKYKNATKVAIEVGCSSSTVGKILFNNNIKPSTTGDLLRTPVDEEFFKKIDTEHKAYWLGFMYADGNIHENKGKSLRVSIGLDSKDTKHLEKFKESLKWEGTIRIYKRGIKAKRPDHYTSTIKIRSNKMGLDLIDKGCVIRKTLVATFPDFSKVPKSLIHHFIRGYFDGDGSVFISNEKHWRNGKISPVIHCRYIGTKNMMEKIAEITGFPAVVVKKYRNSNQPNIYVIEIKRNPRCRKMMEFLYKDSTVYLERKKEIFDQYFNIQGCSETIIANPKKD
jgi:intein-encoded DNA endonuclease-like protein